MSAVQSFQEGKTCFIADIGTTTIKVTLSSGGTLTSLSGKNEQSVFGVDVISRVLYAHHNGVLPLQKKVLGQLLRLMRKTCSDAGILPEEVSGIIITGNTVMLHLVRGLSVQGFEMAPFAPVTVNAEEVPFSVLFDCVITGEGSGLSQDERDALPAGDTPVFFPPCIDAFLGADAVCAALYAVAGKTARLPLNKLPRSRYPLLIADIGTNTEILLVSSPVDDPEHEFSVTCCSTAAGPAFEGGVSDGRYSGSELVHILAELLRTGVMDETGLLSETAVAAAGKGNCLLSQDDVRKLQLAKGAVCAAIETLLLEEGLTTDDVGTFVLCGNFGSALSAEEAEKTGLIPGGLAEVCEYAGNAAEMGAQLLCEPRMRELAKKIAASGKLIQLADSRFFARRYIECMNFVI